MTDRLTDADLALVARGNHLLPGEAVSMARELREYRRIGPVLLRWFYDCPEGQACRDPECIEDREALAAARRLLGKGEEQTNG